MKRTIRAPRLFLWLLHGVVVAQQVAPQAAGKPEGDPVEAMVAAMAAAEQKVTSVQLELRTKMMLVDGFEMSTRGVLRVLRGTQSAVHTVFEFASGDGIRGRVESAQTADGIVIHEDDPLFGEVYLRIPPKVVADLEWAGRVLRLDHLPGMADPRAESPLGASMVAELRRHFTFVVDNSRDRRGNDVGTWLLGSRKPGLDDDDPALPLADRVALFVRQSDQALLEVVHRRGEQVLQQLEVVALATGVDLPASGFTVDGRGQKLREVQQFAPLWEQIEAVLQQAEARCEQLAEERNAKLPPEQRVPAEVRPSRR
jgi:hypothetical protein